MSDVAELGALPVIRAMSGGRSPGREGSFAVLDRPKTKRPAKYKVLLHNDDYTTQEWVVYVLKKFFQKDGAEAVHLMLKVHTQGIATVAVYTREVAEMKVLQVTQASRDAGHPLLCSCEPE